MPKDLDCPNCGPGHKLVSKDNGDGVCAACGGTFRPGPEPKLVGVGEFDEIKGRLSKIESENKELRELLNKKSGTVTPPESDDI